MQYVLTDEQEELRAVLRRLLAERPAARAAYEGGPAPDLELWGALAALGIAGLGVPEHDGGSGGGLVEQVVVAEELGRSVAPVPFVGTALVAHALLEAGTADDGDGRALLGSLVDGALVGAAALDGEPPTDVEAVSGLLPAVYDAAGASCLLVPGPQGPLLLQEVAPEPLPSVDRTRPLSVVHLDGRPSRVLAGPGLLGELRRRQQTLYAAEAVGVAAWALEHTAAHTAERVQFGRPVGTFQAVKHRLADMLVDVECARSAALAAAWAVDAGDQVDAAMAVAMAQAVATSAAVRVVGAAIQLHGGIGVTWEHDLHLYLRRAKALELVGGRPEEHLARIATTLLGPVRQVGVT